MRLAGSGNCRRLSAVCHRAMRFFFAPAGAAAQAAAGEGTASLEAQKEALFQQMLRDPGNLDVAFAYADVSARLGDYEAAVSALERMLLFNPDLPRVQLELGAMYFRMGSYDIARSYFEKAAAANPPPEVRARIDQYLAEIEKGESRHHLSGYFFSGVQYQTDANVAGSSLILSPIGAGGARQPVHQASVRKHLRQRLGALQLRFADAEPRHARRHRGRLSQPLFQFSREPARSRSARGDRRPALQLPERRADRRQARIIQALRYFRRGRDWVGTSISSPAASGSNTTRPCGTTWR